MRRRSVRRGAVVPFASLRRSRSESDTLQNPGTGDYPSPRYLRRAAGHAVPRVRTVHRRPIHSVGKVSIAKIVGVSLLLFTALSRQGAYAHTLKGYFYTNLGRDPFKANLMLPQIAEIILVKKALVDAEMELGKRHFPGVRPESGAANPA
jgi:hypothetical protein